MAWNTKKPLGTRGILIIGCVLVSFGCSTGYEKSTMSHHEQHVAALAQQGQFTEATILRSMHDSASLEMSAPEHSAPTSSEEASVLPEKSQDSTGIQPQQHSVPLSPLQVHLPSGDSPKTGLDEKWHTELGWSLLIDGNYEGAVAAYREALRQNQDFAEAYLGLGSSLRMQKHIPAAIEAYEHALQLKPDYTAALVHLGGIYADGAPEHRDVEKAKQLYARASQQGDPFAKMALQELNTRK